MDFITVELLEKFLNPNLIMSFGVIWFFTKKHVASHFVKIETSLEGIGDKLKVLNENIVRLEASHLEKINDLSERVTRLEID